MKPNKRLGTILASCLAAVCLVCLSPTLAAQSRVTTDRPKPNNCEDALLYLDASSVEAREKGEGYIIAIARLGAGEYSAELGRRRLRFARDYLINRRGYNRIVTAFGERVKGYGRVELYVGGELLYILLYPKRGHISCGRLG